MAKENHVRLIGHVGQDPKLVTLDGENNIVTLSLATSHRFKNKEGQKETKTEWHNIVAFSKIAVLINQYLKSGSHVMIEGHLQTRVYVNKENREVRVTEIVCEDILFLDKKPSE
jgi:single-strand DNA-binding protein